MENTEKKAFAINRYPEGYDKIKKELLDFLPEDEQTREAYLWKVFCLLLQR